MWNVLNEAMIKRNFKKIIIVQLSNMLRRARIGWEQKATRPPLMGKHIFKEMNAYWNSNEFKAKSEKEKQNRASKNGAAN